MHQLEINCMVGHKTLSSAIAKVKKGDQIQGCSDPGIRDLTGLPLRKGCSYVESCRVKEQVDMVDGEVLRQLWRRFAVFFLSPSSKSGGSMGLADLYTLYSRPLSLETPQLQRCY